MIEKKQIMVISGLLLTLCSLAAAVEVNDPIAHWKFDEGSGTTAYDSVGDNDGNLINGPIWTSSGKINGALNFDGVNDYVDVGNDNSLKPPLPVTISAWIKLNTTGIRQAILRTDDQSSRYYGIWFDVGSNNTLVAGFGNGGLPGPLSRRGKDGTTALTANQWYHVAAVLQSPTSIGLYINAVADTGTYSGTAVSPGYSNGTSFIGCANGSTCYFNGIMDDVRIYNRALSAEEVQQLYIEPVPTALEITGPNDVVENSQTQYLATAYYDDDSTKDVTDSAQWSVEPNIIASIDANGLLTTETIFKPQDITIFAQYTEDNNTVGAEKDVAVFAICPKGSALSFDGVNDYVDVDTGSELNFERNNAYTLSAWYKGSGPRFTILSKMDAAGDLFRGYDMFIDEGYIQAHLINTWSSNAICVTGTLYPVIDSLWHHIVVTYDGSISANGLKIYVDAKQEVTWIYRNCLSSTIQNSVSVKIGARSNGAGTIQHLNGIIDDVRIYNRALSAEEIQAGMHTTPSAVEPNLVAYWNFDEGQGQVAHDTSSGGHHGSLGSDPCNPDDDDPAWVDSDAPVGVCSTRELIDRNISEAIDIKLDALDEIDQALERENASAEMLQELSNNRRIMQILGNPQEISRKIMNIRLAILYEQWSANTIEKSIDRLEDSNCPPLGPQ